MPPKKSAPAPAQQTLPAAATVAATTATASTARKPWIKKTPVEVVLEQIGKQDEKVAGLREELKHEERELAKLQQARKVLEGE